MKKKGSAFGYPFLFFSGIFYAFLGFLMISGAGSWLVKSGSILDVINPLTGIGFLSWLNITIGVVDAYIIASSVT